MCKGLLVKIGLDEYFEKLFSNGIYTNAGENGSMLSGGQSK